MTERYDTGYPVPSNSMRDLSDNAQVFDEYINNQEGNVLTRQGNAIPVLQEKISKIITSLDTASFTFSDESSGMAGTTDGQFFRVANDAGGKIAFDYYRNLSGNAVYLTSLLSETGVNYLYYKNIGVTQSVADYIAKSSIDGIITNQNKIAWLWDGSEDAKVLASIIKSKFDFALPLSEKTVNNIETTAGRNPEVSEINSVDNGWPLIVDSSSDKKILLKMLASNLKIQAPFGFDLQRDIGIPTYLNEYVNRNFRTKLGAIKFGAVTDENPTVLITGHSWTDYPQIPTAMRTAFQGLFGDGGLGYVSFYPSFLDNEYKVPPGVTYSYSGFTPRNLYVAVTADGTGVNGQSVYTTGNNGTATLAGLTGSLLTIYYQDLSGSFTVSIDNADPITITCGNTNTFTSVSYSVTNTSHTVTVTSAPNTGVVNIFGVKASISSGNGVTVLNMGMGGAVASNYAPVIPNIAQIAPVLNVDSVLIILGVNESNMQLPVATYKANLKLLVQAWQSALPAGVGLNLLSAAQTQHYTIPSFASYAQAERDLALEFGIGYSDGFSVFPDTDVIASLNLFKDLDHLNANGASFYFETVINKLLGI